MNKSIEREITKLLKELKPEFKNIVFIFNDKLVKENGKLQLAYCDHTVNPRLICFNTSSIKEMFKVKQNYEKLLICSISLKGSYHKNRHIGRQKKFSH